MWREPRHRLSVVAALPGGWLGGACAIGRRCPGVSRGGCRPSSSSEILAAREYAQAGPVIVAGLLGRARLDGLEGAAPPRRLAAAAPAREPVRRYERERPGELVHVDIKKLGRFWTVGKRIHRRPAQPQPPRRLAVPAPRDRRPLAPRLRRAAPQRKPGRLRRLPPPRGRLVRRAGHHGRARPHRQRQRLPLLRLARPCAELGIARRYTRPAPQTNGKAEALVKTLLREWAYRFAYPSSAHRARALPGYLRWYNRHRPHGSIGGRPPISRVSHLCGHHN